MSDQAKKRRERAAAEKTWEQLTSHVKNGEDAVKLLEAIYIEHGPYRNGEIKDTTWDKVRDFFGFDDSE